MTTAMLDVKLIGPLLRSPTSPDMAGAASYGLALPFQVSPTQGALLANLRAAGSRVVDFEAGSDLVVFDRLEAISADNAQAVDRNEPARHPKSGEPLVLVKFPPAVGFVPLGAKLADGSSHPHAGTGFLFGQAIGFPADHSDKYPQGSPNRVWLFDLIQLRFDGQRFIVGPTRRGGREDWLPGWCMANRPMAPAIPDGADLLLGLVAGPPGALHGAGVCRWQRGPDGWQPGPYVPITPYDISFEPSIHRERDGGLVFCARPWGPDGVDRSLMTQLDRSLLHRTQLWRSADGGRTWQQTIRQNDARAASPIVLSRTAGGTLFVSGNPYHGPDTPFARTRNLLVSWPLNPERSGLLPPVTVIDGRDERGPLGTETDWYIDHPICTPLRFADRRLHALLAFRVCAVREIGGGGAPTRHTGTWGAEVRGTGDGQDVPLWNF